MTPTGPSDPTPLSLHYSRPKALLALCLVVLLAGSFGYHLFLLASYVSASSSPAVLAALAATLAIAVALPFVAGPVRALRHAGPVVVLDAQGITDIRRAPDFIPWLDVSSITIGFYVPTRRWLVFQIHARAAGRLRTSTMARLRGFLRRGILLGDWHANLQPLDARVVEVLDVAERLRLDARRRDAAARARQS